MHALDLGCGSGALAMMAAQAGAESVVAVDALEGLCTLARKNVALNALGRRVSDAGLDFGKHTLRYMQPIHAFRHILCPPPSGDGGEC